MGFRQKKTLGAIAVSIIKNGSLEIRIFIIGTQIFVISEKFFKAINQYVSRYLSFNKISETDEASCAGWAALGFPTIYYRVLYFNLTDADNQTYTLDLLRLEVKQWEPVT